MRPTRIQRKRIPGYNMQEESKAINGLPAVSVTRPGKWGNPYKVTGEKGNWFVIDTDINEPVVTFNERGEALECCIEMYKEYISHKHNSGEVNIAELRCKNLACFCKDGEPCHADVLLELANKY